ncbi:putative molybdenum cofactor guanylyltransferase [Clostridium homopropionicum DSM 5847]|uniref:Probable molybdenum cofactor guanylyltransferase n=1 Tax=Clostridium homopropionicum DSM 5847 TaxID=1121318 RepID=A0A0L6ZCJ1_9CLOT|nr:molybdenum cofactor guanylyltransferase [Clostridium homopropionicum]KOA20684.1 putative molybdenum cofactor guanylyltransferase [Clostridium homopropionicum DSM 5847]SFF91537.1 molybdenum cofactor guanylyltransferase [Clostridium homopropionicum]
MKKFGTAVILCGGKSSRMGFDKCKLKIKGKFLIEVIGEKLEEVFDEVILLSNDDDKFKHMKYKVFKDIIPNLGPIGAIYSALKYASSEYVFITACDMPVVNINFINYMEDIIQIEDVEGVVSYKSDYIEPLYAFYSKSMIERIEKQINIQNYKLLPVIKSSKVHYIDESEVRKFSSNLEIFTNLNYKEDLSLLSEIFLEDRKKS